MKITIRLIVALVVVVSSVAYFSAYFQVRQEKDRQRDELERRARLLAESLAEAIEPLFEKNSVKGIQRIVEKFGNRERLAGVAVYDLKGTPIAVSSRIANELSKPPDVVEQTLIKNLDASEFQSMAGKETHVYSMPLRVGESAIGSLAIFHEASYIKNHLSKIWRHTFLRVLVQLILISLVTLIIVRWSIAGPIAKMAEWMKQLRAGTETGRLALPKGDLFAPIAKEVKTFAHHLSAARAAAEEEARLRQSAESLWTRERLKEHVKLKLKGRPLFVISNREPYMHQRQGGKIEAIVPAGGLVTALEPVLRACEGTWIAHGAGDADFEVVNEENKIMVPPDDPVYTLKRVMLTKEEEKGYYYGFTNEGLWPLCHIAHTRPIFREDDWNYYQAANQKFADAALREMEGIEEPFVLIQDCHFSLLPRILKSKRPDARIALFWHIPWPNPEAFGICPWQKELIYGMLGADLIGFHTQFHCNNFLDTVDRVLESRIDWQSFTVHKEGHITHVKPFPISVAFPAAFQDIQEVPGPDRASLLKNLGIKAEYLGVGVERLDYTKGILERFRAVESFLEKYPDYQGKFTFVQLGAPSRTHIKQYHDFIAEVEAEAERISWRFKAKDWKPIVFLKKHHSHQEILPYYRSADLCMVTSLHDGMNLVAKEFVAARDDESGVLVLSQFAGAASELKDALIVNPYDIGQMAEAIRYSLEMDPKDKALRMKRMREFVKENNIYRWAGNLITGLSSIRLESQADPAANPQA